MELLGAHQRALLCTYINIYRMFGYIMCLRGWRCRHGTAAVTAVITAHPP